MFQLQTPWMLALIVLPFVVYYFFPAAKTKAAQSLKVPFFNRIQRLNQNKSFKFSKNPVSQFILPFIIYALLCFALSGPQWLGKPVIIPQKGRDIMLALDLSGSMQTPDMELNGQYFDRLAVVKIAARKFIKARVGDRVGLILFGTRAYLQTPLTFDRKTVLQMLNDATIGLAGPQTAIGDAIGLALKQLQKAPGKSKVMILLTDGGNNAGVVSPLDAAKMAKKLGIKIFTIGIGAKKLVVQGLFGPEVIHPTNALDEDTLKQIAHLTGGIFFRANSGDELQKIYQSINQLVPVASKTNRFRPVKPLYPWPLGLALLLSLGLFYRFFCASVFTHRREYS